MPREHTVLVVEPAAGRGGDEKLRAVRVWPGVGHREDAWQVVPQRKVLIRKLAAIDGLAARAVAVGEIAALAHESRDDAVKGASLKVQRLARSPQALFARAKGPAFWEARGWREEAIGGKRGASGSTMPSCGGHRCAGGRGAVASPKRAPPRRRERGLGRAPPRGRPPRPSDVARLKFSAVRGTTSANSSATTRPSGLPSTATSRNTRGFAMAPRAQGCAGADGRRKAPRGVGRGGLERQRVGWRGGARFRRPARSRRPIARPRLARDARRARRGERRNDAEQTRIRAGS